MHGNSAHKTTVALTRIIKLYDARDADEPGKGYAEKCAKSRAQLPEENSR